MQAYKCVLYGLQACSQCQLSTHGEKTEMLSSAVDFTHSAPIPQPHLSSHDLMRFSLSGLSLPILPSVSHTQKQIHLSTRRLG